MPAVEEYWYMQDHDDLRAAAAELLMNLLHCEEVKILELFKGGEGRLGREMKNK